MSYKNMPTDEQIALAAIRRIRANAWREGRNDAIAVMALPRWRHFSTMYAGGMVKDNCGAYVEFRELTRLAEGKTP